MSLRLLLLAALLAGVTACERGPSAADLEAERRRAEERQADEERIAELRALEDRAAAREAEMQAARTDQERREIAAEHAKIDREKQRLAAEQKSVDQKRQAILKEEQRRAAEQAAAASKEAQRQAQTERTLDFFYEALDPHGEWMEVGNYGYCWRPNAASRPGWRPYLDGNWAWTDYGWTWASREPFGWATYHYGRWTRVRRLGWVWVPGSEWAPAWVAWRRSDRYIGWAPLPPEAHSSSGFTAAVDSYYDIGPENYSFVETENFGEPTYVGQVVAPEQNITVINKTVNVTNVTYKKVENKTVVFNGGPNITEIHPRTEVRRLKVERVNEQQTAGPAEQRGNVLRMNAPVVASAPRPEKQPSRVKERVKVEEVERGWSVGGDRAGNDRFRAQQKDEAQRAERAQRANPGGEPQQREVKPAVVAPPAGPVENTPAMRERPRRDREEAAERPRRVDPAPATPNPVRPVPATPAAVPSPAPVPTETPERPEAAAPSATPRAKRPNRPSEETAPAAPAPAATPAAPAPAAPVEEPVPPAAEVPEPATPAATPRAKRPNRPSEETTPAATPAAAAEAPALDPAPAEEAAPAAERGRRLRNQQQSDTQAPAVDAAKESEPEPAPVTEAVPAATESEAPAASDSAPAAEPVEPGEEAAAEPGKKRRELRREAKQEKRDAKRAAGGVASDAAE